MAMPAPHTEPERLRDCKRKGGTQMRKSKESTVSRRGVRALRGHQSCAIRRHRTQGTGGTDNGCAQPPGARGGPKAEE